jgi:hypothetical protein
MDRNIEVAAAAATDGKTAQPRNVNLHISEKKLIELVRSIKNGEITSVKIQNGLPVFYIIDLKERRFL